MRVPTVATAAACAVLGFGGQALAQAKPTTAPEARQTDLSASVNVLYDSNIARSNREFAAARHLSLDDELITPQVNFTIARPLGRQILFLEGYTSYVYHIHDTILNRENINVTGGVNAHILRCQELVTGSYARLQNDLAEQSAVVVQNVEQITTVSGNVDCGRSIGLAPTAGVSEVWRTNGATQVKANDSRVFSANAGLGYRNPTLGKLSLVGSYSDATFPNSILPIPGLSSRYGYALYSGGVSYENHIGTRISATLSLSYTDLQPGSPLQPKFQGVTYDGEIDYQVNARMGLKALAARAVEPSNYIGSNFSTNENYSLIATYSLGTKIDLNLTGTYRSINNNVLSPRFSDQLRHSDTADVLLSATYTLSRRFKFMMTAGDEQRNSNVPTLNYNSARLGLTFTATY
jgi:hypothetical protein